MSILSSNITYSTPPKQEPLHSCSIAPRDPDKSSFKAATGTSKVELKAKARGKSMSIVSPLDCTCWISSHFPPPLTSPLGDSITLTTECDGNCRDQEQTRRFVLEQEWTKIQSDLSSFREQSTSLLHNPVSVQGQPQATTTTRTPLASTPQARRDHHLTQAQVQVQARSEWNYNTVAAPRMNSKAPLRPSLEPKTSRSSVTSILSPTSSTSTDSRRPNRSCDDELEASEAAFSFLDLSPALSSDSSTDDDDTGHKATMTRPHGIQQMNRVSFAKPVSSSAKAVKTTKERAKQDPLQVTSSVRFREDQSKLRLMHATALWTTAHAPLFTPETPPLAPSRSRFVVSPPDSLCHFVPEIDSFRLPPAASAVQNAYYHSYDFEMSDSDVEVEVECSEDSCDDVDSGSLRTRYKSEPVRAHSSVARDTTSSASARPPRPATLRSDSEAECQFSLDDLPSHDDRMRIAQSAHHDSTKSHHHGHHHDDTNKHHGYLHHDDTTKHHDDTTKHHHHGHHHQDHHHHGHHPHGHHNRNKRKERESVNHHHHHHNHSHCDSYKRDQDRAHNHRLTRRGDENIIHQRAATSSSSFFLKSQLQGCEKCTQQPQYQQERQDRETWFHIHCRHQMAADALTH